MEDYVKKGKIEKGTIFILSMVLIITAIGGFLFHVKPPPTQPPFPLGHYLVFYAVLVFLLGFIANNLISRDRNRTSMKGHLLTLDDLAPNLDYQILWISLDKSICQIELMHNDAMFGKNRRCCEGREMYNFACSYDLDFKAGLVFSKRQDGDIIFIVQKSFPGKERENGEKK